jgi:hypothetical protein
VCEACPYDRLAFGYSINFYDTKSVEMIIKLTLCGLVMVLIAVLAISYYINQEAFIDVPDVEATGKFLIEMEAIDGKGDGKGDGKADGKDGKGDASDDKKRRDSKDPRRRKKGPPAGMPQTGVAPSDPFDFDDMMTPINSTISPQVSVSDDAYAAMLLKQKSEILQDLQKIVRNEILAQRSTNPVAPSGPKSSTTHSTEQGKEYSRKNHKRDSCTDDSDCDHPNGYKPNTCDEPPCDHPNGYKPNKCDDCEKPDMREYIRKDSIPCMNCNLDY